MPIPAKPIVTMPDTPDAKPPSLLFLIGYRGTGKTSIAHLLAARLGWHWLDADAELEKQSGRTIRAIFADEAEQGFRERESGLLEELCRLSQHVIATGGGVVIREINRQHLRNYGKVIWLQADAETIWHRLQSDTTTPQRRPDLTTGGLAEIQHLLKTRLPLYEQCADWTVDTRNKSPATIVEEITTFADISKLKMKN